MVSPRMDAGEPDIFNPQRVAAMLRHSPAKGYRAMLIKP